MIQASPTSRLAPSTLAVLGAACIWLPSASCLAAEVTALQLAELVATARSRMPAFEVDYRHCLDIDAPLGSGERTYTNASPSAPRAAVRLVATSHEFSEVQVSWHFDPSTGVAAMLDPAGRSATETRSAKSLGLGSDIEVFLGLGASVSLHPGHAARQDLVTALRTEGTTVRADRVTFGGYECWVVDVPTSSDPGDRDRMSFYVSEALHYAVVGLDVVVADSVWSRRVASEFVSIAPGAPEFPLVGELVERPETPGGLRQRLEVARDAAGAPRIRVGDAVNLAWSYPDGTTVTDLDTGMVRIATASRSGPVYATFGAPMVWVVAASCVLAGGTLVRLRRRRLPASR